MSKVKDALRGIYQKELAEHLAYIEAKRFNECDDVVQIIITNRIIELNEKLKELA